MEKEARLVRQERPLPTSQQVDILRLIGRGTPRQEIVDNLSLTNHKELSNKLTDVYKILGVHGQTAGVQQAITLGILNTEELVDRDFDWQVFKYLNSKEKSILQAFIHAKDKNLTDEEFKALNIETARNPKRHIEGSIARICSKLGLPEKTVVVVYYRAFLEQEQNAGEKSIKPLLTEKEVRLLELVRRDGLTLATIGQRLFGNKNSVYGCKEKILDKLGVSSLENAVNKAQDLGILPRTTMFH